MLHDEAGEEAEGGHEEDTKEEVRWPVDEDAREGEEEDQGVEGTEGGDPLGVVEALSGPAGLVLLVMEVVANHTGDGGAKEELASAEGEVLHVR